jgi:hypothetical protein
MLSWPLLAAAVLGVFLWAIQTVGRNAAPSTQTSVLAPTTSHERTTQSPQPTPFSPPASASPVSVRRAEPVAPAPPGVWLTGSAEPVPVTVRRAQLVRLPESQDGFTDRSPAHIDETHTIQMPYGEIVNATLRGFLEQENQLPRVGRVGDMYIVGETPWIWLVAPGAAAATWVDP